MICYISKVKKSVAWLLFIVFYIDLVSYARVNHIYFKTKETNRLKPRPAFWWYPHPSQTVVETLARVNSTRISQNQIIHASGNRQVLPSQKPMIGGPGQPELSSFKSVGADNMVNLFTGDFSYNIPLLDVGGYPVNLFYNAGITMDQEATWVGLGWNINPGSISRNMRGLPDDFNGDKVTKIQSAKKDLTVGVNAGLNTEFTGNPVETGTHAGIFWNNRKGISMEIGGDFSIQSSITRKSQTEKTTKDTVGSYTIKGGVNLNSQNGLSLNAGFDVELYKSHKALLNGFSTSTDYNSRQGLNSLKIEGESNLYSKHARSIDPKYMILPEKQGSVISFARSSFTPSIRMPLTRFNGNLKIKLGGAATTVHVNGYLAGSLTNTYIADKDQVQQKPAYGYMYYEKANNVNNALLDFNRLNDGTYTIKSPVISVPNYTYDIFSMTGEGTGGTFRGYRGNMGFVRDNYTKSREGSFSLAADAGTGFILHGGVELGGVYSHTEVGDWVSNNILRNSIKFNQDNGSYQGFYFKNPGEKAIIDENYFTTVGGDELVRPKLENLNLPLPAVGSSFEVFDASKRPKGYQRISVSNSAKTNRDKRTQIITYLNAEDAERVGLDSRIYSYSENIFKPVSCSDAAYKTAIRRYNPGDAAYYRKAHHLSQIEVLENDGKRYIYGLPAYTTLQKEVNFSLDPGQGNHETQLTKISAGQNSVANTSGRDASFQSEIIPAYAHSFLLTAILSPDYVDITGDGISDDDIGTSVKFNYTKVNKLKGTNSWYPQKWRTPVEKNTAYYNEGLKTDNADDKGLYSYGEKELWYTHSIETKNMVATFTLGNRNDGKQVSGEQGGIHPLYGQRKLERIDLYTKADYTLHGSMARPVKTVHFAYGYTLCPGIRNSISSNSGKLTLDSVWFSYNGNYKQTKNKYRFKYAEGRNGISGNPRYDDTQSDRWGNYKASSANPGFMSNADYPYTLQNISDSQRNNIYAAAWSLEKIMLPAGAVISVGYEADDYAYVQNRRASQMMQIAGFAKSVNDNPSNRLYTYNSIPSFISNPGKMDNHFVFFNVPEPVTSKADVYEKYLAGIKQLLLKIWVDMPTNSYGSGYEPVTIYATIKDYYTVSGNKNQICIELNPSATGGSVIMETVIQFLKDFLPSKAYKGYDVGNQSGLRQLVSAIHGMAQGFFQALEGFENNLKANGKCKLVNLDYSFGRLDNPYYRKYGGGHRVKSVVITDNWKKMVNPSSPTQWDSYYGQLYDYTTTEVIGGVKKVISSGVATYEPGIGNDENPFREVLQYYQQQPLGPTNVSNIELPILESFFPAPSVGYSRVTVKSIHNKENKNLKSGSGIKETEFYTSKDFPVVEDFTDFDTRSRAHYKPSPILKTLFHQNKDFLTLSQGFRIVLNDMNGKIRSEATYPETDLLNAVNKTNYYYRLSNTSGNTYRLDNKIKVIESGHGIISEKVVGKDVEIMNDFREHYASTQSAQIPLNIEAFTIGPFPIIIPSILNAFFKDESIYRSATTLKVITDYGILDSVSAIDKGSVVSTKQLVFDAETGEVLITRTNNEFNKPQYLFNYPAHWVNSGMDLAYKNIDAIIKNVRFINGRFETPVPPDIRFESGDEIYAIDNSNSNPLNSEACTGTGGIETFPKSDQYKIWAIDVSKDQANPGSAGFIFIDRYGNPYNATDATIRIIRSGKRNMGSNSVGAIASMEAPFRLSSGVEKLDISNSTEVINASAIEFKETWKSADGWYQQDSTIRIVKWAPIRNGTFGTINTHTYSEYHKPNGSNYFSEEIAPEHFLARHQSFGNNNTWRRDHSWILFEIKPQQIRADAEIISARLSLYSHRHIFSTDVNHNFFWEGSHHNWNPHANSVSHNNTFRITRMLTSWPADKSPLWKNLYLANGGTGYLNELIAQGPFSPTQDLISNNRLDETLDITGIFKGMLRDKYDPLKNFATGIKINLLEEFNGNKLPEARVCFYGRAVLHGKPDSGPLIEAKYYYCSEATDQPPVNNLDYYAECVTYQTGRHCFSVFNRKRVNPYVYGLLGNWRPYRSYTFYGDRKQTDVDIATNISRDGAIKDFVPYWILIDGYLKQSGNPKWVWNSEITQYNRKGVEVENRDPLSRYNSGVYGYRETLPILVANNSKLREVAYEGFEDHEYKDAVCEQFCKPYNRHFKVGNIATKLSNAEHHTGKYSLAIAPQNELSIAVSLFPDDTTTSPTIRIKIDSSVYNEPLVRLNGKGLKRIYYSSDNFTGYTSILPAAPVNLPFSSGCKMLEPVPPQEYQFWLGGDQCNKFSIIWRGLLQASYTGNHSFWLSQLLDDIGTVTIKRQTDNFIIYSYSSGLFPSAPPTTTVFLQKGQLYKLEVTLRNTGSNYGIDLQWKTPFSPLFTPVPLKNLYPEGMEYLANNTVVAAGTSWCILPDTIQAVKNPLIDSFCLIPGKQYLFGCWVKEDNKDCKCVEYKNNTIQLTYNNSVYETPWKPAGNIIEGWQRYESSFTVPQSATSIKLTLKNHSDKNIYFDDLRFHPFNANIKTFVYNPENLRLSAELDENNYATFYEYDDDGILARVKKETKDGIYTIKETRTALQHSLTNF